MIDVQQRTLSPFEQHVLSRFERIVQIMRGLVDVGTQPPAYPANSS
jgi:hypothetical protein